MTTSATYNRDGNWVPITTLGLTSTKSITYVAGTTGATGATTLFTVTGLVAVRVFAVCSSDLTSGGAATIGVGVAGNTASLIAQTTATAIDNGEIWIDTSPATVEALPAILILSGTNIIQTIATTTVTGGVLTYYVVWTPISPDGELTAT